MIVGRALLWAAEKKRVQKLVTEGKLSRRVVTRFIAGDTIEDAVIAIKELNAKGIGGILDLLGEGVQDAAGAEAAYGEYLLSIRRIEETKIDTTVSIKLSQLGLAFDKGACIDYVRRLAAEAQAIGTYVEIDMEQSRYVTDTIDIYKHLQKDFDGLRLALQVYLRRTAGDLEHMAAIAPKIRLVKGAYKEPEDIAFQKGKEIDAQFRFLTSWLFDKGSDPGIATHDSALISHTHQAAQSAGSDKASYEIQMLFGIRRDLQEQLAADGYRVRTYVPFGSAWYPYLMRRMAERPANLRFFLRALAGK